MSNEHKRSVELKLCRIPAVITKMKDMGKEQNTTVQLALETLSAELAEIFDSTFKEVSFHLHDIPTNESGCLLEEQ